MNRPLLTLMLLVLIGAATLLTPVPTPRPRAAAGGDIALFRGIVSDLRNAESTTIPSARRCAAIATPRDRPSTGGPLCT
jgi:hypothetical protein